MSLEYAPPNGWWRLTGTERRESCGLLRTPLTYLEVCLHLFAGALKVRAASFQPLGDSSTDTCRRPTERRQSRASGSPDSSGAFG